MAEPADDIQVKIATDAAEKFVESYYPSLNNPKGRAHLTEFYIRPTEASPLQADITLNGNTVADPAQLQSIFENQVSKAHYEVQSFDCQVINTNYNVGINETMFAPNKDGKKMSILVMVNGSVKYFRENTDGETRGFTETLVLVPKLRGSWTEVAKGCQKMADPESDIQAGVINILRGGDEEFLLVLKQRNVICGDRASSGCPDAMPR